MATSTSLPHGPTVAAPVPPTPPPGPPVSPPYTPPVPPSLISCGLAGVRFYQSYFWRFIVTNLNSETMTMLDRLASDRHITKTLNDALELGFRVPSDNKRVNIPFVDGDPKVDEGTRLVYGFRHEGTGSWVCRAATLAMQVHDAPDGDVSKTEVNCWDPWRYLDYLPIINPDPSPSQGPQYWSSNFTGKPKPNGIVDFTIDEVVVDQLSFAEAFYNDLFIDYGQTPYYTGNIGSISIPFPAGIKGFSRQNGSSIGQFLRDLCSPSDGLEWCDIVLEPIYDPVNRPGILCQLSIYPAANTGGTGAGVINDTAIFSWDRMPRTLTSIDRLKDGTQRANKIQNYHSRGGPPVQLKTDIASLTKYKTYFRSKYFPTQGGQVEELENLATAQLLLRASGVETITVSPTPERAKVPLLDYDIGDTVWIYSTRNMRQEVFAQYRVLQIPITISDEALETVDQLTLKKATVFESFAGPETQFATAVTGNQEVATRLRRSAMSSLPGP